MHFTKLVLAGIAISLSVPAAHAQQISWLSQSQNQSAQYPVEIAAITEINAGGFNVLRNEFQALGISMADGLRLVREGTFNLASIQVGLVAGDDPFLEGIDLIGVSTNMDALSDAVSAYRDVFDARLEERFGVKALAVWPFGGQILFCNEPITSLADLSGLKVRSFTASMSALLERLGATPVTLAFPEVYPALQRGVASCGITSATSANTGKWPEVTSHVLPLAVSGSIQAPVVNLEWFNSLPEDRQAALTEAFSKLEDDLWALAYETNGLALSCTTGGECDSELYQAFDLELVEVNDADMAELQSIASEVIISGWVDRCESTYAGCGEVWYSTVGAARGFSKP
jgi:TRAP-type C4-dicarboxylate transport system substrate-binding protein